MFCQKCGKSLDDEAIVCPACGTPTINYSGKRLRQQQRQPSHNPMMKHLWKLIVGAYFALGGLRFIGRSTLLMIVFVALGGSLIIWWLYHYEKNKKQNNE